MPACAGMTVVVISHEYVTSVSIMKNYNTDKFDQLDDEQLHQISLFLQRCPQHHTNPIDHMDGFFTALHCGPTIVPPSIYTEALCGSIDEDVFANEQEMETMIGGLMAHWNNVGDRLYIDDVFLPLIWDESSPGNDWAIGFLQGIDYSRQEWLDLIDDEDQGGAAVCILALANEHNPDPNLRPYKEPISTEQREKLLIGLSASVMRIFQYFANHREFNVQQANASRTIRHAEPKIGRNAPCPCGSGKKYKKCCAKIVLH